MGYELFDKISKFPNIGARLLAYTALAFSAIASIIILFISFLGLLEHLGHLLFEGPSVVGVLKIIIFCVVLSLSLGAAGIFFGDCP